MIISICEVGEKDILEDEQMDKIICTREGKG